MILKTENSLMIFPMMKLASKFMHKFWVFSNVSSFFKLYVKSVIFWEILRPYSRPAGNSSSFSESLYTSPNASTSPPKVSESLRKNYQTWLQSILYFSIMFLFFPYVLHSSLNSLLSFLQKSENILKKFYYVALKHHKPFAKYLEASRKKYWNFRGAQ